MQELAPSTRPPQMSSAVPWNRIIPHRSPFDAFLDKRARTCFEYVGLSRRMVGGGGSLRANVVVGLLGVKNASISFWEEGVPFVDVPAATEEGCGVLVDRGRPEGDVKPISSSSDAKERASSDSWPVT